MRSAIDTRTNQRRIQLVTVLFAAVLMAGAQTLLAAPAIGIARVNYSH